MNFVSHHRILKSNILSDNHYLIPFQQVFLVSKIMFRDFVNRNLWTQMERNEMSTNIPEKIFQFHVKPDSQLEPDDLMDFIIHPL